VIARRELFEESSQLGRVSFSVFLRFAAAGEYQFEPTRLELFRLLKDGARFAPYASYFNNTLFEVADLTSPAEFLFVESDPFGIRVLELPDSGQEHVFSGLFAPVQVETRIKPDAGDVGQLMELSIRVISDTPTRFLSLSDLKKQVGLQHRFWVEEEPRRIWHPDGTEFLVRFRPLATTIQAFPSLTFQVFDSESGKFSVVQTASIPMDVGEKDGKAVFRLEQTRNEDMILTDQPAGIWHNDPGRKTSDFMNMIINSMADGFWLWIVLVIVLALALLPGVRERRRRAIDPAYRSRVEAYAKYNKRSGDSAGDKRNAFRMYLAAMSQKSSDTFTVGDAEEWLQWCDATETDRATVRELFQQEDAEKFDRESKLQTSLEAEVLDALVKRIFHLVKKEMK